VDLKKLPLDDLSATALESAKKRLIELETLAKSGKINRAQALTLTNQYYEMIPTSVASPPPFI